MLEKDNALSAEATGEHDQDGAGCEAFTRFGGVDGFACLCGREAIVSIESFMGGLWDSADCAGNW